MAMTSIADLLPLTERQSRNFYRRITPGPGGCLEWSGYLNPKGYGTLGIGERKLLAHRVAWALGGGEIPPGAFVLHRCDNPRCCNVNHLFLGNDLSNHRDKARKNRGTKTKTGLPYGVMVNPNGTRYTAQCSVGGVRYLGTFDSIEEASQVATAAKEKFFNA